LPRTLELPIVSVVLVADLGGTSLRVGLVDRTGAIVATETIVSPERPDRLQASEIDPQIWWQDFADAVEALARAEPDAFSGIAAVAISAVTRTQVFLGSDGQVLRPAILWSDARAEPLMQDLLNRCPADHPEASRLNAFHPLARLWWLHCTEPEIARAVASVVEPKDFLNHKLTGAITSDVVSMARLEAAAAPGPDGRSLLSAAGLDRRLLPRLLQPTEIAGAVQPGLAGALGRLAGVPVIAMANDTWASVVGLGALRPGYVYDLSGTTEVLGIVSDRPATAQGLLTVGWGDGISQLGGPSQSGADTLVWLLSLLGRAQADPMQIGPALEAVLAGPRDEAPVLFLPYLLGERTPYWDPSLRGALIGLNRRHRAVDLAYAVMEGVGFLNRLVLERAEAGIGTAASEVRFGGGGAANALWCQIKADILGRPVIVTACEEHGLLGAAIAAWSALEGGLSLADAQERLVRIARRYEPDAGRRQRYDRLFALYRQAEDALRPISHRLAGWDAGALAGMKP
jgi:xylulokinase